MAVLASAALVGVCWLALSVLLELLCLVPGALGRGARRVADLVTPRVVRRAAGALLGVGVVAGLAPGASVAAPVVPVARVGGALGQGVDAAGQRRRRRRRRRLQAVPLRRSRAGQPRVGPPLPDPGFTRCPTPDGRPPRPDGRPPRRTWPTSGGWVPTRPTVRTQPDVRVLSPSPRSTSGSRPSEVVVRRGDSLWSSPLGTWGPTPRTPRSRRPGRPGSRPTARSSATTPTSCGPARCSALPRGPCRERRAPARRATQPAPAATDLPRGGHPPLSAGHRGPRGAQRLHPGHPGRRLRGGVRRAVLRSATHAARRRCPTPRRGPPASRWRCSR